MYYHTVILHLFRPFLKVNLVNSTISPRITCTDSASAISVLADKYRALYGFRRACSIIPHCIFSANIVDAANLPEPTATRRLAQGIRDLMALSINHAYSNYAIQILAILAQKCSDIPDDVRTAFAAATMYPALSVPQQSTTGPTDMPTPVSQDSPPPGKENFTGDSTWPLVSGSGSQELFWSPTPHPKTPLHGTSDEPMDISSLLYFKPDDLEQYERDGFKVIDVTDPLLKAQNHSEESG
jgi:hypothetical protein